MDIPDLDQGARHAAAAPAVARQRMPGHKPWRRRGRRILAFLALALLLGLIGADRFVAWQAADAIAADIERVPPAPVALLLGTASTHRGRPNQFYRNRLLAAAALYKSGRVRGILLSGDNATRYYNEPQTMRRDLIALGVPDAHLTLDYAGFRTLDSVARARQVFGQRHIIIVTQRFHAERAIFLARSFGIQATAFAAADPSDPGLMKVRIREVFARAMAVIDVLMGRTPKFLGQPEPVHLRPLAAPVALKRSGADAA